MTSHQVCSPPDKTKPSATLSPRFREPITSLLDEELARTGSASTSTVACWAAHKTMPPRQPSVMDRKSVPERLACPWLKYARETLSATDSAGRRKRLFRFSQFIDHYGRV